MKKIFFSLQVLTLVCTASLLQAQTKLHIVNTFHIASPGGWDYIAVGPGNNRVYVSHGTQVNILNASTGDSLGVIDSTIGVHGIAFDKELGKGYTSNGRLNNVTVFDLASNKVLNHISTGTNPDAIMFDGFSKKIITCNGRSQDLSVIDPVTEKVVATIPVGGKPETAVSNEAGKIFVNIEDKNEIVEVDITKNVVENHWPLGPGKAPTGLAIDRSTKKLFAGCGDNKWLIILDASDGKIVDSIGIGDGCDGVAFDNGTKNIFTSNGEGTLSVVHEASANKFEKVADVPTKRSARTVAVDEKTHNVFLPAADYEPLTDEQKAATPRPRPKMIAGSFQVLVVGEK
ncbi:MAG: YncE family protein [Chitinophagales bacterium]